MNHLIKRYCASCAYFDWVVFPGKKTTCNSSGSLPTTPACEGYSPNPFVLQDIEKLLLPLASILKKLPVSVIPILYDVISNERQLRKFGYIFMEKVAVRYRGAVNDMFISNFTIARVYSTAPEDSLYVVSEKGFRMLVTKDSVMKYDKFMEIRKEWLKDGHIVDPTLIDEHRPRIKQIHGVPETLDDLRELDLVKTDTKLRRLFSNKKLSKDIDGSVKTRTNGLGTRIQKNEEFRVNRDSKVRLPEKVEKKRGKKVDKPPVKKKQSNKPRRP
jgi:hypothetical protein